MNIAPAAARVAAPTLPLFPAAPDGWHVSTSNPKNDIVIGYSGPVLHAPLGHTYIGHDGQWRLLDDMLRAALAVGSRGGHGAWSSPVSR
jgi:hypothetical protein